MASRPKRSKRKIPFRNINNNFNNQFLLTKFIHHEKSFTFCCNIVYVNVMKNMSVDCDCCAVAEDPCIADIGILASTDPIAIDQACLDLVYACSDPGKPHLIERIESRNGIHTIEAAAAIGLGSREYELVEVV